MLGIEPVFLNAGFENAASNTKAVRVRQYQTECLKLKCTMQTNKIHGNLIPKMVGCFKGAPD